MIKNVQKQVYHKNRFYQPKETPKIPTKSDEFHARFGEKFGAILALLENRLKIIESFVEIDNLVVRVEKEDILEALAILRDYGFDILSEMSAIHLLDDSFELFYQLLSMEKVARVRVLTHTKKSIDSVEKIYRNAVWSERECYDLLGVIFTNHPNLKRLIMPEDWYGHPLRKDYPLHGDEAAQWYEVDKIFGEEYREIIGAEQRDSSFVDPNDTRNFAHLGFEVPHGAPPSDEPTEIRYQEESGVFVVTKFDKQTQLEKRR